MINKYQCIFESKYLETRYRLSIQDEVKQQYKSFTFQYMVNFKIIIIQIFIVFYGSYYIQNEHKSNIAVIVCSVLFLLALLSKLFIDLYPQKLDSILVLMQVSIIVIQSLDRIFELDEEGDENETIVYNFDWFYGFQACYFQFIILLQGYNMIYSTVSTSITLSAYLLFYPSQTIEYLVVCCSFTSNFIGALWLKREQEINKRNKFLDIKERRKWNNLFDEAIDESILILRMDKDQDQIVINTINNSATKNLQITSNQALRKFLRNIRMEKSSLETYIRELLASQNNDQELDLNRTIIGQHDKDNHKYQIQLTKFYQEQQLMIVLIIKQNQELLKNFKNELVIITRLLNYMLSKILQILQKKFKYKIEFISKIIEFQTLLYLIQNVMLDFKQHFNIISVNQIKQMIMPLFKEQLLVEEVDTEFQCQIQSNVEAITYILKTLIQIYLRKNSKVILKQIQSTVTDVGLYHFFSISIINQRDINSKIESFLQDQIDYKILTHNSALTRLIQELLQFKNSSINFETALQLIIMKVLLQLYGTNNKISVRKLIGEVHLGFYIQNLDT